MEADESARDVRIAPRFDAARREPGRLRPREAALPSPGALRPLGDDIDALIRAVFACGFTSAAVQGRHDVSDDLSHQLTTLIDALDQGIRDIRRALAAYETA